MGSLSKRVNEMQRCEGMKVSVMNCSSCAIHRFRNQYRNLGRVISQWLVRLLLGSTKQKIGSYIVPNDNPTNNCEMKLAPDFFSYPRWQMDKSIFMKLWGGASWVKGGGGRHSLFQALSQWRGLMTCFKPDPACSPPVFSILPIDHEPGTGWGSWGGFNFLPLDYTTGKQIHQPRCIRKVHVYYHHFQVASQA